jgi:hypothetical protein
MLYEQTEKINKLGEVSGHNSCDAFALLLALWLLIIVIGTTTISFMQCIYTYIPETNHVPKQYNVTVIL